MYKKMIFVGLLLITILFSKFAYSMESEECGRKEENQTFSRSSTLFLTDDVLNYYLAKNSELNTLDSLEVLQCFLRKSAEERNKIFQDISNSQKVSSFGGNWRSTEFGILMCAFCWLRRNLKLKA